MLDKAGSHEKPFNNLYLSSLEKFSSIFLKERREFNPNGEDQFPSILWWKEFSQTPTDELGVKEAFGDYLDENLSSFGHDQDLLMSWLKSLQHAFDLIDMGYKTSLINTAEKANYFLAVLSHLQLQREFNRAEKLPNNVNEHLSLLIQLAKKKYVDWVKANNLPLGEKRKTFAFREKQEAQTF